MGHSKSTLPLAPFDIQKLSEFSFYKGNISNSSKTINTFGVFNTFVHDGNSFFSDIQSSIASNKAIKLLFSIYYGIVDSYSVFNLQRVLIAFQNICHVYLKSKLYF